MRAFYKSRLAQLGEILTINLKVVSSNPNVGKIFFI